MTPDPRRTRPELRLVPDTDNDALAGAEAARGAEDGPSPWDAYFAEGGLAPFHDPDGTPRGWAGRTSDHPTDSDNPPDEHDEWDGRAATEDDGVGQPGGCLRGPGADLGPWNERPADRWTGRDRSGVGRELTALQHFLTDYRPLPVDHQPRHDPRDGVQ